MSVQETWTDDWQIFVKGVSKLFCNGLDDGAVSDRFAEKRVIWTGQVARKRFDITYPGVQMDMPVVNVELPDGRHAVVDFLFLNLSNQDIQLWRDIEIGRIVRFATKIRRSSGPFAGIRWSDLDDKRGVILFSADGGVPLM